MDGASSGETHFNPDWPSKEMVPGIAVALPLGRSSAGISRSRSFTSIFPATRLVRVGWSTQGRCDCRKGKGLLPLSPVPSLTPFLGSGLAESAAVRASIRSLMLVMLELVSSVMCVMLSRS